jgi:hypothetical protein
MVDSSTGNFNIGEKGADAKAYVETLPGRYECPIRMRRSSWIPSVPWSQYCRLCFNYAFGLFQISLTIVQPLQTWYKKVIVKESSLKVFRCVAAMISQDA